MPEHEKNQAAVALGSIRTAKKAASSAENARKAGQSRRAPCTCGQEPHRYTCPVYRREAEARSRAKKKAAGPEIGKETGG